MSLGGRGFLRDRREAATVSVAMIDKDHDTTSAADRQPSWPGSSIVSRVGTQYSTLLAAVSSYFECDVARAADIVREIVRANPDLMSSKVDP